MLALAAGRLTEAEELVPKALALGEHAQPTAAIPVHRIQLYTLRDLQGRLDEVEPAIRDLIAEYPARQVFRCALAHVHARLGQLAEARRALDDLARDRFSALPFDQEWLYGMSLLAETSALLGDTDAAVVLYDLLVPWGGLNAVDQAEGIRGAISRYLGILATATKRWSEAEQHFERALAMNAAMGARPWLAHTQTDYGQMLQGRGGPRDRERARDLLDAALRSYRELGMQSHAERAAAPARQLSTTS
jgi:tetratricopeptide (TPR) repeat protein